MYTIDPEEEEKRKEEVLAEDEDDQMEEEKEEIRKVGSDTNESIAFYPKESFAHPSPSRKKSKKTLYFLIVLILILAVFGFLFKSRIKTLVTGSPKPTPTPTVTSTPTPTPNPLIRSDWSFEVLNGTSTSGQAKKLADKLIALGYPVVKTGNADKQSLPDGKQSYEVTQILVKKELMDKIDLVVADLKDTVKIASMAGELKDSTASARIIIGKDLSL